MAYFHPFCHTYHCTIWTITYYSLYIFFIILFFLYYICVSPSRSSWNEPSLTLTCSPAQKQTERCHPEETRPLRIREYARIQTFPDNWEFMGSMGQQYKQIGNAVPVNLSYSIGISIVKLLNDIYE